MTDKGMIAGLGLSQSELEAAAFSGKPVQLSPGALRLLIACTRKAQRLHITAMFESSDYKELRAYGLIDTGQEMTAIAANFPAGAKVVQVAGVDALHVWIQPSDKGIIHLAELAGK